MRRRDGTARYPMPFRFGRRCLPNLMDAVSCRSRSHGADRQEAMTTLDDQVIATLYGAVDDKTRWVELMDLLRQRLGVEGVAAQLLVPSRDDLRPLWETRDSVSERNGALHDSWANTPANPRFRRPQGPPQALEIDSDQRWCDYSTRDRHVLRDGLARCGLGPAFWISQQLDEDRHFTLIFHRAADDGRDMGSDDRHLLEAMAPHFSQAVRLWMRLAEADARRLLVEQAGLTAMVACDRRLRVHWMNADARRLLGAGVELRLRDGHLACAAREDQESLAALVEGRADRAVRAIGGDRGPVLHLRARRPAPAPGQFALSRDLVLLVMTRPDCAVRYDAHDIARLFGLTLTEAALAANLAGGMSVSEFAAARGVAEGTARQHLKRVLAKTGAGRQSELVRRICLSVAGEPA
jgi:DNA-binding CsgD family transcriptional regulator